MRNRISTCEVTDRSAHRALLSDETGKSVSPSAATAPLVATTRTPRHNAATAVARPARARTLTGAPPASHHAVNARHASSVKVLIRCTDRNIARAKLALSA